MKISKSTILTSVTIPFLVTSAIALCADITRGLYQLETQTLMPHLDEMRHKTRRSTACFDGEQIQQLFPIMRQPGLKDCYFRQSSVTDGTAFFRLECDGLNGAVGTAILKSDKGRLKAVLDAKLGGKNMTFTQTSWARKLGDCVGG